ncbi:MAG: hypothetical protein RH862_15375 [Leptospiraceae bacterium]
MIDLTKWRILPLAFSALLFSCTETKISPPVPGPAAFAWGDQGDVAISRLTADGWTLISDSEDQVVLSYPVSNDPEIEASDLFADAEMPEEPYTLRLYLNKGKLAIARVQRRDTTEAVDTFVADIKTSFNLAEPAVNAGPESETTEAGNRITTSQKIFESGEYVLKLNRTTIEAAEEKMKGGLNDQVELEIYPKSQNEGISAEALK